MRRIYESRALHRDDDDPFAPKKQEDTGRSTSFLSNDRWRTVNWEAASHALLPMGIRDRAITVTVETPDDVYDDGRPVEFQVTMQNRLPVPIRLVTRGRPLWEWSINGLPKASEVASGPSTDEPSALSFDRGEWKQFSRVWPKSIRISEREWQPAPSGEYTLSVALNVDNPEDRRLSDSTTIYLE